MSKFDSKIFNPEVFGKYIDRIPNTKKSELAKSGALGSNANARAALSNQTGSLYCRVPYFGKIDPSTSQNNDGATNIQSTNTTTMDQGFVTASRMDGWTEKSFAKNITAGVDFMDNVAKQLAEYKVEVKQEIMLAMLQGIFSMDYSNLSTARGKAAKEFVVGHTTDTTDVEGVSPETLNKAIQKACGDNKSKIKLVIMDSTVATDLENQKLLSFMKYTDADGIQKDLTMAQWNGRTVLIDDDMPTVEVETTYKKTADVALVAGKKYYTRSGSSGHFTYTEVASPDVSNIGSYYEVDKEAYTAHTTYFLGEGAIIVDPIPDSVPFEMYRDPKTNGGEDTLYVRDRYICGFEGLSFEKPVSITASATNNDLKNGENWAVINDGANSIPTKSIAIARLISRS